MVRDIYDIEWNYGRIKELCRKDLPRHTYDSFFAYADFCLSRRTSKNRIWKVLTLLRQMALISDRQLSLLNEDGITHLLSGLNERGIADSTFNDYILVLRGYLKYILRKRTRKYDALSKVLKRVNAGYARQPIDILQPYQIDQIKHRAQTEEMRVIISLLWETGARIGEILNLKKEDIIYDEYALLRLDGKTGIRFVRIVESVDELNRFAWDRPLGYIFSYTHVNVARNLERIKKKLGMPELYCHLFRKSRATYLSKFMTEQQLKKYLGWTPGSKVLSSYLFLSCEDANSAILSMHRRNDAVTGPATQTPLSRQLSLLQLCNRATFRSQTPCGSQRTSSRSVVF